VSLGWLGIDRCDAQRGGTGRVLRQQVIWSVLAAGVATAATVPSYRAFSRWSYLLFLVAVVLLVFVLFSPPIHGARRWIRLGPVGFQPSEFAKVAYVLALARYLAGRAPCRRFCVVVVALGITAVPLVLILEEPDLGTSLLLVPVLVVMLAVAGMRRLGFVWLALGGMALLPLLWVGMSDRQKGRVFALLNQPGPEDRVSADAYQLHQAKQMLALGGVWGSYWSGLSAENPAAYHLPEARGDFIFCVVGERFGLVGMGLILALYAVLVTQGFGIAAATDEPFGRLAAAGLTALLATQVLVNTGMTLGLLPITGVPLPLVSYGGSGMVVYGLVIGLLVNISSRPARG